MKILAAALTALLAVPVSIDIAQAAPSGHSGGWSHGGGPHGSWGGGRGGWHGGWGGWYGGVYLGGPYWPYYDPYFWDLYYYPPYPGDYYGYPPDYAPSAPPPSSGQAPPMQSWYFCHDPKGFYPYVQSCKSGWQAVPAVPPDAPTSAPGPAPTGGTPG